MEVDDELAYKIHGICSSESDSDSSDGKSDFDLDYEISKPPPLDYDSIKSKLVVIKAEEATSVTVNSTNEYSAHKGLEDTSDMILVTKKKKKRTKNANQIQLNTAAIVGKTRNRNISNKNNTALACNLPSKRSMKKKSARSSGGNAQATRPTTVGAEVKKKTTSNASISNKNNMLTRSLPSKQLMKKKTTDKNQSNGSNTTQSSVHSQNILPTQLVNRTNNSDAAQATSSAVGAGVKKKTSNGSISSKSNILAGNLPSKQTMKKKTNEKNQGNGSNATKLNAHSLNILPKDLVNRTNNSGNAQATHPSAVGVEVKQKKNSSGDTSSKNNAILTHNLPSKTTMQKKTNDQNQSNGSNATQSNAQSNNVLSNSCVNQTNNSTYAQVTRSSTVGSEMKSKKRRRGKRKHSSNVQETPATSSVSVPDNNEIEYLNENCEIDNFDNKVRIVKQFIKKNENVTFTIDDLCNPRITTETMCRIIDLVFDINFHKFIQFRYVLKMLFGYKKLPPSIQDYMTSKVNDCNDTKKKSNIERAVIDENVYSLNDLTRCFYLCFVTSPLIPFGFIYNRQYCKDWTCDGTEMEIWESFHEFGIYLSKNPMDNIVEIKVKKKSKSKEELEYIVIVTTEVRRDPKPTIASGMIANRWNILFQQFVQAKPSEQNADLLNTFAQNLVETVVEADSLLVTKKRKRKKKQAIVEHIHQGITVKNNKSSEKNKNQATYDGQTEKNCPIKQNNFADQCNSNKDRAKLLQDLFNDINSKWMLYVTTSAPSPLEATNAVLVTKYWNFEAADKELWEIFSDFSNNIYQNTSGKIIDIRVKLKSENNIEPTYIAMITTEDRQSPTTLVLSESFKKDFPSLLESHGHVYEKKNEQSDLSSSKTTNRVHENVSTGTKRTLLTEQGGRKNVEEQCKDEMVGSKPYDKPSVQTNEGNAETEVLVTKKSKKEKLATDHKPNKNSEIKKNDGEISVTKEMLSDSKECICSEPENIVGNDTPNTLPLWLVNFNKSLRLCFARSPIISKTKTYQTHKCMMFNMEATEDELWKFCCDFANRISLNIVSIRLDKNDEDKTEMSHYAVTILTENHQPATFQPLFQGRAIETDNDLVTEQSTSEKNLAIVTDPSNDSSELPVSSEEKLMLDKCDEFSVKNEAKETDGVVVAKKGKRRRKKKRTNHENQGSINICSDPGKGRSVNIANNDIPNTPPLCLDKLNYQLRLCFADLLPPSPGLLRIYETYIMRNVTGTEYKIWRTCSDFVRKIRKERSQDIVDIKVETGDNISGIPHYSVIIIAEGQKSETNPVLDEFLRNAKQSKQKKLATVAESCKDGEMNDNDIDIAVSFIEKLVLSESTGKKMEKQRESENIEVKNDKISVIEEITDKTEESISSEKEKEGNSRDDNNTSNSLPPFLANINQRLKARFSISPVSNESTTYNTHEFIYIGSMDTESELWAFSFYHAFQTYKTTSDKIIDVRLAMTCGDGPERPQYILTVLTENLQSTTVPVSNDSVQDPQSENKNEHIEISPRSAEITGENTANWSKDDEILAETESAGVDSVSTNELNVLSTSKRSEVDEDIVEPLNGENLVKDVQDDLSSASFATSDQDVIVDSTSNLETANESYDEISEENVTVTGDTEEKLISKYGTGNGADDEISYDCSDMPTPNNTKTTRRKSYVDAAKNVKQETEDLVPEHEENHKNRQNGHEFDSNNIAEPDEDGVSANESFKSEASEVACLSSIKSEQEKIDEFNMVDTNNTNEYVNLTVDLTEYNNDNTRYVNEDERAPSKELNTVNTSKLYSNLSDCDSETIPMDSWLQNVLAVIETPEEDNTQQEQLENVMDTAIEIQTPQATENDQHEDVSVHDEVTQDLILEISNLDTTNAANSESCDEMKIREENLIITVDTEDKCGAGSGPDNETSAECADMPIPNTKTCRRKSYADAAKSVKQETDDLVTEHERELEESQNENECDSNSIAELVEDGTNSVFEDEFKDESSEKGSDTTKSEQEEIVEFEILDARNTNESNNLTIDVGKKLTEYNNDDTSCVNEDIDIENLRDSDLNLSSVKISHDAPSMVKFTENFSDITHQEQLENVPNTEEISTVEVQTAQAVDNDQHEDGVSVQVNFMLGENYNFALETDGVPVTDEIEITEEFLESLQDPSYDSQSSVSSFDDNDSGCDTDSVSMEISSVNVETIKTLEGNNTPREQSAQVSEIQIQGPKSEQKAQATDNDELKDEAMSNHNAEITRDEKKLMLVENNSVKKYKKKRKQQTSNEQSKSDEGASSSSAGVTADATVNTQNKLTPRKSSLERTVQIPCNERSSTIRLHDNSTGCDSVRLPIEPCSPRRRFSENSVVRTHRPQVNEVDNYYVRRQAARNRRHSQGRKTNPQKFLIQMIFLILVTYLLIAFVRYVVSFCYENIFSVFTILILCLFIKKA